MRAIVYDSYGPPEVLRLADVPKPTPAPDEVRVRVLATTVNRTDCGFRSAEYVISRLFSGLLRPKQRVLGSELAGEIDAVGGAVKKLAVGDRVFGLNPDTFGAHAEYVCVPQDAAIATIPEGIGFDEAAAVLDGLMLGNNMLRQVSFDRPRKLLVIGASGSIGTAVLQLAKIRGAHVTAVGNPGSVELLRSLGADTVLDYTKDDFAQHGGGYDAIIDAVGKSSFSACRHLLTAKGLYVSSELGPYWQNPFLALAAPLMRGRKVGFPIPSITQQEVLAYRELLATGRYRAIIDRTYALEEFLEATRYVETGQKTGNVVLRVAAS